MPRRRIIPKDPGDHRNYFLVDANFLAYAAIPRKSKRHKFIATPKNEEERAVRCIKWWQAIKRQLKEGKAKVYIPDICIAEAFKVLAKWYYKKKWFPDAESHNRARKRLRSFIATSHEEMAKATRVVTVHDVPTNRDIIIAVDRFFLKLCSKETIMCRFQILFFLLQQNTSLIFMIFLEINCTLLRATRD